MNFKWVPLSTLFLPAALIMVAGCAGTQQDGSSASKRKNKSPGVAAHYSAIDFPEFRYTPPHPRDYRVELDSGVVAYLVPDSTLALLDMTLLWRHNHIPKKPEDAARLNLYSLMLKDGGTVRFTPEVLEDSLEFLAATVSVGMGNYQSNASLSSLRENAGGLMDLLPEVALQPRMDKEIFALQQAKYLERIRHRYNTPQGVMSTAYEYVTQGSHPSNWMATEAEVKAVRPAHLKELAGMGFGLDGLVIGVAGQFTRDEMQAGLNRLVAQFGKAAGEAEKTRKAVSGRVVDSVPAFQGPREPGVYLVDREFSQATVKMGAPGVKRPHPDYYPLVVANYIFGEGGFTSRLMTRIRSEEGLAYGVRSFVESDYHREGSVGVSLQTKASTGAYATKLVLEAMRKMAEKGITDEELQRAKDGLSKSLPSLFDTPPATASIFAQSEIWGRDLDHFENYRKRIETLGKEEVEAAFRKYFKPEAMRIVIVGPKTQLLEKDVKHQAALEQFGTVTEITTKEMEERKLPVVVASEPASPAIAE